MTLSPPEVKAKEIFDRFNEWFGVEFASDCKVASLICVNILKDGSNSETLKQYWANVAYVLSKY